VTPSKEAIEAADLEYRKVSGGFYPISGVLEKTLSAAYAIDVAPLERRIGELETELARRDRIHACQGTTEIYPRGKMEEE
jgi:hypothetical protein